jgi:3-oxoacyl-[acyl-carrier protein] reductase
VKLEGKVAIVTGGTSGIGAATVRRLAADGARVANLDLRPDPAGDSENVRSFLCDVSSSAKVDAAFAAVVDHFGQLDILVNNAGALGLEEYGQVAIRMSAQAKEFAETGRIATPLEAVSRLTDEQWRRMLATHLDGTFYCSRAAMRLFARQNSGVIVNMASIAGLLGVAGNPHYSAAKGGILAFTRSLAKEAIQQGVRVNAIAPGFVDTPLRENVPEALRRAQLAGTPIGRVATADEVASTVAFLVSEDARYVIGETLTVAGGAVTI